MKNSIEHRAYSVEIKMWPSKHNVCFLAAIFCSLLFALCSSLFASFEDTGTGARATALGGAFTPMADDVYSLYYNPAGLVYLKRKELSATYGLLNTGLKDKSKINSSYVAYGHPLKNERGTLGLSWDQLSIESLYTERTIALGYGRRLSQRWAAGVNFKQLYRQYGAPAGRTDNTGFIDTTKSDPVFSFGDSKSNVGIDFGMLYRLYQNYSFGLMFQNFNEPNMAISDKDEDPLLMTIRTGLAYNERNLTLVGEIDTKKSPTGLGRDIFATFATEKWWLGAGFAQADLAARGSLAFGSRSFSQFSTGLSYRLNAIQVDYGFMMPLGGVSFGNTHGNHRLTFTLKFGKTIVEPDYEIRMRSAEISAKKAEEELEQVRKESEKLAEALEKMKQDSEVKKQEITHTRQTAGKDAALKQSAARLAESMERYWRRKSDGASLNERIGLLNQILKIFSDSGLDISTVEKELAVAKSDRAKAEVDLAISWSYYQKIVARGASIPERIQLLSQMIERFARNSVDLTNLHEELKSLRKR